VQAPPLVTQGLPEIELLSRRVMRRLLAKFGNVCCDPERDRDRALIGLMEENLRRQKDDKAT
jgi:hypothetical protein